MLHVHLLGEMSFRLNQHTTPKFQTQKEMALLAYLAHTGGTHSREAVADLLWEARTTKQSLSNLRTVLARLRKSVGDALVITRRTIALNSDSHKQTDSVQFEAQLQAQREADALPLYRGELMDGFYLANAPRFNEWLAVERERLRQLAAVGLRTLAATQASAGAFADGVATMQRLVALDALDEVAQRNLMRLHALNGDQRAAERMFTQLRNVLANELGIAPSAETLTLRNEIENGLITPPPIAPPLPHNLPHNLPLLFGRKTELQQLTSLALTPHHRVVVLTGPGGIGKTSLSLATGHNLLTSAAYTSSTEPPIILEDGIWFIGLEAVEHGDPDTIRNQLATLAAEALGLTFHKSQDYWTQLLAQLASKNTLLILDNIEQILDAVSDLIPYLLNAGTGVRLLLTSRTTPALSNAAVLSLDGLVLPDKAADNVLENECVQLFAERAMHTPTAFSIEQSLADVVEICHFVEGIPLALELAAASLGRLMIGEVVDALRSNLNLIGASVEKMPDRHRTLQAVFNVSWQTLDPRERETLATIAVFRGGFTRHSADAILQNGTGPLFNLQHHALLKRNHAGRFHLHPLVRQLARKQLTGSQEQTVLSHHAAHYASLAHSFAADLQQNEARTALATLHLEQANLRAGWHYAIETQMWPTLSDSLTGMHPFYQRKGLFHEETVLLDSAIAALGNDEPALLSQLLTAQAWCLNHSAELEKGLKSAEQAAKIAKQLDNPTLEAHALLAAIQLLTRMVNYERALDYSQRIIELAQAAGDPLLEAAGLSGYGSQMLYQPDATPAAAPLQRALDLFRAADHKVGELDTLILLGGYAHSQAQYEQSVDYFREALTLSQQLGNVPTEAESLGSIGVIVAELGDVGAAQDAYEQALRAFQQLNIPESEVWMLSQLGLNTYRYGDYASAEGWVKQAYALSKQIDDVFWEARTGMQRGMIWTETGELGQAIPALREAFEKAVACGHPRLPAMVLFSLGLTLLAQEEWASAEHEFNQAIAWWIEADRPSESAPASAGLAYASLHLGRPEAAAQHAAAAWNLWQQHPEKDNPVDLKLHWLLYQVCHELDNDLQQAVLTAAQDWLDKRASRISQTDIRQMFLQNVAAHHLFMNHP